MSGWFEFFPPVLCAATKAKRWLTGDARGPRDKTPKTPALERGFLYQPADTLLVETCAAGKDIFYHLCGGRQDNKVVGTEIQMGPFVWVNKEGSLHDRPILTFLPALVPHEHTFNPSLRCTLCVCLCVLCMRAPVCVFGLPPSHGWELVNRQTAIFPF